MTSTATTRPATGWILALTGVGSLMAALDTLVVSTALTTIHADLHASVESLEWTVNGYNLSFAVLLIVGAGLGDRFGRRRMYVCGLLLFAAASAACALAPNIGSLIAARIVQGAGAALLVPVGLALLTSAFPPDKRGAALGIFSAITGVSVALGPLVGGAVVQGLAWQWIFWLNVPIGVAAAVLTRLRLSESRGPREALDGRGLALVTAGALGVVWGLVRGNAAGWGSAEVLGAILGGAALLGGFVWWERRSTAPMLPMRMFRSRAFSAGNAAIFCTFAALFTAVFFFAQFLQTGLGYDPLQAGLRLLPWTATFITVAPAAGALSDRIGERPLMTTGLLLQAVGLVWIASHRRSRDGVRLDARAVRRGGGGSLPGHPCCPELGGGRRPRRRDRQGRRCEQHDAGARRGVWRRPRRGHLRGPRSRRIPGRVHGRLRSSDLRSSLLLPDRGGRCLAAPGPPPPAGGAARPSGGGCRVVRPSRRAARPVVHLELHTDDPDAAASFLSGVLGWHTETVCARTGGTPYLTLDVGDRLGGGIVDCGQTPGQWVPYAAVERVDQVTERAVRLGATVLMAPREGPLGCRSVVSTPAGGILALWEPYVRRGWR